jgi:RNA polymerase sigma-70 factor (ECF subfamily)
MTEPQLDHEAFLQLFMRHERAARAYARTLASSWGDVDDVMQQSSLVAWRKFGEFDQGSNFSAWLATIVRFESLKFRRTKQRDRLVFSEPVLQLLEAEGVEDLDQLEQQRTALQKCLDRLGDAQRQLLKMAYSSGRTLRELAESSGRSVEGFYKTLQRLRAALLKCAQRELTQEKSQ